jgi:hypothetical protein
MIEPDVATFASAAAPTRSLDELLGDTDGCGTVVHLPYLCVDAIVLERRGHMVDLLFDGEGPRSLYDKASVQPVDGPARQAALLRQALTHQRKQALRSQSRMNAPAGRDADTMAAIREHLIDEHRRGGISRSQLDGFLRAFAMPALQLQSRVAFTVTGTYLVNSGDTSSIRDDGQDQLAVVFEALRDVVAESDIYTVTIDSVTPAE